jgi:hypothetical protein
VHIALGTKQDRMYSALDSCFGLLNGMSPRIVASIAVAVRSDGHAGVMKGRDGFYECSACELIGVNLAGAIAAVVAIRAFGLLSPAFSLPSDLGDRQGKDAKAKPSIR